MPWFKVDDSFHSHPKVLAASPAALGLWVVAGSWSGANLSDGFVPDHALPRLLPDAVPLAQQLVAAGLWKRTRGGYRFHDWGDFNPTSDTVKAEREAARERMRSVRARRKKGETSDQRGDFEQSLEEGRAVDQKQTSGSIYAGQSLNGSPEQQANVRALFATPTRPDPTRIKGGSPYVTYDRAREDQKPPSPRCEEHLHTDNPPPCGSCAEARQNRERWEAERRHRIADAPHCRRHRGQLAHNCGPCRSERLAAGIQETS